MTTAQYRVHTNKLSRSIKPLDAQVTRLDTPLPKVKKGGNHFAYGIVGCKGTGKSTLLLNLLTGYYKRYFNRIYLVSPTAARDPKFDGLVEELTKDRRYHETCDEETIQSIIDSIEAFNQSEAGSKPSSRCLLVLDDCLVNLPKAGQTSIMNKIWTCHRHLRLSLIVLVQKYNSLNTLIRTNLDVLSFFKITNTHEFDSIAEDLNLKKNEFRDVYDAVFGSGAAPGQFITVNFMNGDAPMLYRKFDKLERI